MIGFIGCVVFNAFNVTRPAPTAGVRQPTMRETQQERFRDTCLNLKYMANRPDKFPEIVRYSTAVSGCIQLGLWEKEKYQ